MNEQIKKFCKRCLNKLGSNLVSRRQLIAKSHPCEAKGCTFRATYVAVVKEEKQSVRTTDENQGNAESDSSQTI